MPIDSLFAGTTRPNEQLFFSRGNPTDPRMGDRVRSHRSDYATAEVVVLGCPQDEGVRRNGGRVGAAAGPDTIRDRLYRLVAIEQLRLFDLGNTIIGATLEETHAVQRALVAEIVRDGKIVISLGGGNDISYPDCAGLADAEPGAVLAFNIDSHYDVREDRPRNSGTPYRMLIEEGRIQPQHFWELGSQPFAVAQAHTAYLHQCGAHLRTLKEWRSAGVAATLEQILAGSACPAIFWGIDLDVVRAADSPGVSAPNPTGLSAEEIVQVAELAGRDPRSRVFEISELNPNYDLDQRSSRLAAILIWSFLAYRSGAY
ncbi:MAG: formimidoylglutamase [Roseiflexaceae bacterium]